MSLSVQFAESSQPDKAGSSGQAGANTILEIEIERTGQSSVGVTTGFCTVCRIQPNRAGSSGRARASELNFTGRPATWPAAGSSCWDPRGKVHGRAGQLGKATGGRLSHRKRNQARGLTLLSSEDTGPGVVMPLVRSNASIFGFLWVGVLGGIWPLRDASVVAPTRIHPSRTASLQSWENTGSVEFRAHF